MTVIEALLIFVGVCIAIATGFNSINVSPINWWTALILAPLAAGLAVGVYRSRW